MRLLVWLGILAVTACSSLPVQKALDQIRPGMDKDKVLAIAENPKRTFRENMQDHWIYTYFQKDREWRRDVVFEDGKVVKVTQATSKESFVKDLERSDSMEEFETKAREHQKKAGQFKAIDGQPEDTSSPE